MRYAAKLLIPSRCLAVINGYLNAEREGEFQGEDNTIIHTVSFPDGLSAAAARTSPLGPKLCCLQRQMTAASAR